MQVKKFEAPTMQEALDAIKRELGPEAIILQTKKNKKGFGLMNGTSVEITVAVSDRSLQKKSFLEKKLPPEKVELVKKMPASKQAELLDRTMENAIQHAQNKKKDQVAKITSTRYIDIDPANNPEPEVEIAPLLSAAKTPGMSIEEELKHLKRMMSDLQITKNQNGSNHQPGQDDYTDAMKDAYEHLILAGVERKISRKLLKNVAFELDEGLRNHPDAILDQLTSEVMKSVQTTSFLRETNESDTKKICALVGPTGVGKTTTLAKIASHFILKGKKKVGLINLDAFKVGANEQLQTYAQILNVPYRSVSTKDELKMALKDFKSLDLIFIDTAGRSQKDTQALRELKEFFMDAEETIEPLLCLSSSIRETENLEIINRFGIFNPKSIAITKLDESVTHGSLLNIAVNSSMPLSFFTTGQRVPDDIEEASSERVAALVMDL